MAAMTGKQASVSQNKRELNKRTTAEDDILRKIVFRARHPQAARWPLDPALPWQSEMPCWPRERRHKRRPAAASLLRHKLQAHGPARREDAGGTLPIGQALQSQPAPAAGA